MDQFLDILLGTIISVIIIYMFLRVNDWLYNKGHFKLVKLLKVIIVLTYIALVLWLPKMEFKIYFGVLGAIVCYLFSKNILQENKISSALIMTAIYGILWLNAAPFVWEVLYPPQYHSQGHKISRVPIYVDKNTEKSPDEKNKSNDHVKSQTAEFLEPLVVPKHINDKPDFSADTYDDDFDFDSTDIDDYSSDTQSERSANSNYLDADNSPSYNTSSYSSSQNNYKYSGGSNYSSGSDVYVAPYVRSNGSYVQGHYRTRANGTTTDNYSHRGNINPYTGKRGYSN